MTEEQKETALTGRFSSTFLQHLIFEVHQGQTFDASRPPRALLQALRQLHEAGSPVSPQALDELRMLIDEALGPGPWDVSHLSATDAYLWGLLHGSWRELRDWLESMR